MPHIDLVVRQRVGALVAKCMEDYESEIEDAYSRKDGEFAISFKAKIKPKGENTLLKIEMAFDPHEKVKDSIEETIDRQQKPLFGEDQDATV